MTVDFAPASAANSGEAVAGICKGRQPLTNAFFRASRSEALFHLAFTKEIGNKDYVHFFVTRQKNEPKKTRLGALPLSTPTSRATRKNATRVFAQSHAAVAEQNFCVFVSESDTKTVRTADGM